MAHLLMNQKNGTSQPFTFVFAIMKLYIVSVFILPRFLIYLLFCAILAFSIRILMIHADKSKPISGWRKVIVRFLGRTITRSGLFVQSFMWINHKNDTIDYSKWLGPDYKTQKIERPPIIISNHMSWSVQLLLVNFIRIYYVR